MRVRAWLAALISCAVPLAVGTDAAADAGELYLQHCASCHGTDRLGGTGPALFPGNLGRLRPAQAAEVIGDGRPATQMPGFRGQLSEAEIEALVGYIYSPPERVPEWGSAEIADSRIVHGDDGGRADRPVFDADPMNLFMVVEKGDHAITVLDGDRFEPIARFHTRFALHGGIKYSPDGRHAYFMSRDGWVTKYDIYNLRKVVEVRAGVNSRNIAVSADGLYLAVANYLPHSLVILDAGDLSVLQVIPVHDDHGRSSRVSAVYAAPPRHSFIAALKDLPEIWEIPYGSAAEALPVYRGIMHDYRRESGEDPPLDERRFPVRRIKAQGFLDDFFFDPGYEHVLGASRDGGGQVVNLRVGRTIASLDVPGLPHLGSGITWDYRGREVMATPNLKEGALTVIDTRDWSVVKRIETLGPGFFLRSHDNTPYVWADVFFGPHKDALHVIDKDSLEIVETLRPSPGKTAAHVEFTADGRYALVSVWDVDGALVVYDAETLEEVKRLPMKQPSGKYNVGNKIRYARGTSH